LVGRPQVTFHHPRRTSLLIRSEESAIFRQRPRVRKEKIFEKIAFSL
jgi:hypothetical protein